MNTAKLRRRAIHALGLTLLLSGPAWAAPLIESLPHTPRFSPAHDTGTDNDGCQTSTPSTIAFNLAPGQAAAGCTLPAGDQAAPQAPSYQGYRFAEPMADSLLHQATDNRRYSF
ncbi:hypothetical protein [Pseudomonas sp.]|uniref:hypothetical protein n=1 Tax=Pseudomonas sp. TaxID=306 RepID=UPI003D10D09B